jgi:hypothetical protein
VLRNTFKSQLYRIAPVQNNPALLYLISNNLKTNTPSRKSFTVFVEEN